MGDRLRLAFGVMGNAASLLLYAAPIMTFKRVVKKKSTEEFSCVPYIVALLNCLLYSWYGFPIVSHRWENFPLITVNGLGILFEFSFVLIYFWFTSPKGKVKVGATTMVVLVVFCITAIISALFLHDHHQRKVFVGSFGVVASVTMYSSPLVVVNQVIRTMSVEFMPFHLSFFSFLACSLWLVYGLLSHDLFIASPSLVGCPLGILQLLLYFKYRKSKFAEESDKHDLEKNEERFKQVEIVLNNDANDKS